MKPQDFIYQQAYKKFVNLGFSDRDSGFVAADAVKRWRATSKAVTAVEEAIKAGKKQYKKTAKDRSVTA